MVTCHMWRDALGTEMHTTALPVPVPPARPNECPPVPETGVPTPTPSFRKAHLVKAPSSLLPAAWEGTCAGRGAILTGHQFGVVPGTALYNPTDLSQQPDADAMDRSTVHALHAPTPLLTDFWGWQLPQGKPICRGHCVRTRCPLSTQTAP